MFNDSSDHVKNVSLKVWDNPTSIVEICRLSLAGDNRFMSFIV